MTHHIVEPFGTLTLPAPKGLEQIVKIKLNTEGLTTLLRSNIYCYLNKNMTQELMNELVTQIIESIDSFINKTDDIL